MAKERFEDLMKKQNNIRNIAIAAHIDHGKTTFSDNLLAGAGMLSEELAGKQLVLDFHEDESERGITIDSASVSMIHNVKGETYLINLILNLPAERVIYYSMKFFITCSSKLSKISRFPSLVKIILPS